MPGRQAPDIAVVPSDVVRRREHNGPTRAAPIAFAAVLAAAAACFSDPPPLGGTEGSTNATEPTTSTGGSSSATASETLPTGETCDGAAVRVPARMAPSDIILVVDTSGSMVDSFADIQVGLGGFAEALATLPDVHLLLVSALPTDAGAGVCVPPPVGAMGCPPTDDTNPPQYARASVDTAGADPVAALESALQADPPVLRPDSNKHIVFVADSGSTASGDDVHALINAFGPSYVWARVHGTLGGMGAGGCEGSTEPLDTVIAQRRGIHSTLCPFEGDAIFESIIEPRPACNVVVPASPFGTQEPPISITLGTVPLQVVSSAAECGGLGAQAVADEASVPPRLAFCPATCWDFQDAGGGDVTFEFPCPEA